MFVSVPSWTLSHSNSTMDMNAYVATSTAFAGTIASTFFNAFFGLLSAILPYLIGILVFYVGFNWARRVFGGGA